jgi:glycosyltransferase involved in cell wall biosynthesis
MPVRRATIGTRLLLGVGRSFVSSSREPRLAAARSLHPSACEGDVSDAVTRQSMIPAKALETPRYSAVIPVYNSAGIVAATIAACARFFEERALAYEIVLVDDGSADASWSVLQSCAAANPRVVAVRLLRNCGQHSAVHCGLAMSRGEYVVVLDDDLQNPPEEIAHLIRGADEGADVVFGRFLRKRHSVVRRLGSWLINEVNTHVFGKRADLVLTNFKLIERRVVDRILAHRTHFPYINGLAVLYARSPVNVSVEHRERSVGASNYRLPAIVELLMRILFNYSAFPLRLLTLTGISAATLAFCLAAYVLVKAVLVGTSVPGWASVAVMVAFFSGMILLMLSMIGEYLVRLLAQTSRIDPYHVVEVSRHDAD